MSEEPELRDQSADEELLREIRDRYKSWSEKWRPIREERQIDMRYILGDPWSVEDKKARVDVGRPTINHDELNQYVSQAIGSMRAAKRGIKVEPGGSGSDDKTAEFRQNLIRGIEYKSQAQGAYLNAYQAMLEGSYGYARVGRQYVSDDVDGPDDQEIVIGNIANPDSVLYDPDCKKADWSDPRAVFVLDPLPIDEFKRQYPKAAVRDFTDEDRRVAKDWIGDRTVLTAEYWRVETKRVRNKRNTRFVNQKSVVQYITNGIEILERNPQPGPHVPIIPFIGLERWLDEGGGPTRKINSMIRLGRDPQMSLAYLCSQQMEEAGLSPKVPYKGYVGQFETDKEAWDTCTKQAHAYLQADPITDSSNGQILPLPQREQFTPNIAAFEAGKDSCRRAIQAALGISPLPTAMQRNNEKSGVALDRIQQQAAQGTLTYVDKFEAALAYLGRVIDSWIPSTYDAEDREVGIRMPDDSQRLVKLNTAAPYVDEKTNQQVHYPVGDEKHDITISTAPTHESQRDAASDFLDLLITNLANVPVAPPQAAKLLSMAIRMKQLGPMGDEMAEIISPDENGQQPIPPEAQQAIAKSQQELQAIHAYAQQQEAKVKELEQEKQARIVDNEYKLKIEQLKIDAQLAMAEINTKAQVLNERVQFVEDVWKQLHEQQAQADQQASQQAHEQTTQASDQAHAQQLQQQQAEAAQQQQVSDQAHQQGMAEQAAEQQAQSPEQK